MAPPPALSQRLTTLLSALSQRLTTLLLFRARAGARWLVANVLLTALLGACSSATFDGTLYRGDGFAFRIPAAPAGWARIDTSEPALVFRDEANGATIMLQGRCVRDGDDVPLAALTQHLFLQFTDRDIRVQEVVPFDGREAMHTTLDAKLDGVPMRYDAWVLKKDGCVYDLLYMAAPPRFERGLERFLSLVHGFSAVSPDGA